MASPLLLLAVAVLRGAVAVTDEGTLPRVQTQGDVLPFVTRANGSGARSHRCANGTEFIVTLADEAPVEDAIGIMNDRLGSTTMNHCRSLRHMGDSQVGAAGQLNAMAVCIPEGQDVESHLQVLMAMEGVQAVEENMPLNQLYVPWHLDRIDQVTLPLDGMYNPHGTGFGVRVYMTDTGVDARHPEFEGRVQTGYSAVYGQVATRDMGSHGTHTAGIVRSRNYGVAKLATIIPVKIFSDRGGGASGADIVEGVNWAISNHAMYGGSAVLSMSIGMPGAFYAGDQALLRATQRGLIPVVAAGNDHADACGSWPAQSPSAITVGATDINDYRSTFSNWGSCVDIYAPGTQITSTLPNGRVGLMSGTSMACPVVSGTVALYLEKHPGTSFASMKAALLRNAVGQRNVVASRRMLLVQAVQRTAWQLRESSQLALSQPVSVAPQNLALALSAGCALALVAIVVALKQQTPASTHAVIGFA